MTTIAWYRQDLRIGVHPALGAGVDRGESIVPVYVWSPEEEGSWAPGRASRRRLHHSIESLDASLCRRGLRLIVMEDRSARTEVEVMLRRRGVEHGAARE